MKILTTKIFTRENKKWVLSRKEETSYSFFRLKINLKLVIGIGYFTAYEDEKILVKTFMLPFLMITEMYEKSVTIINP